MIYVPWIQNLVGMPIGCKRRHKNTQSTIEKILSAFHLLYSSGARKSLSATNNVMSQF